MHNAAFEELGLDWVYSPVPTLPERLSETVNRLLAEGYRGANVTVPHKQAIVPFLASMSEAAEAIGAVNTLVFDGEGLKGANTDGDGFMAALRETGYEPCGRQALVLGAGGASRAVVHALSQAGCSAVVHNRTAARAQEMAWHLGAVGPGANVRAMPEGANLADLDLEAIDLLVNTTTVGMWPDSAACPWPATLDIPQHWTVFDLVYNPARTGLLARAEVSKARSVSGLAMLVHQGALAFELWTQCRAPLAVMRSAAEAALVGTQRD
jgi:shikimate dehydrogenase